VIMSSTLRGVAGGGFGRQDRFQRNASKTTPAAIYEPRVFTDNKIQAPLYKSSYAQHAPMDIKTMNNTLPNPYHGRQSFMIGKCSSDLCYYDSLADKHGPQFYPNLDQVQRKNERAVMGKADRFISLTKQYVSKGHNDANLCTASKGPKYYPQLGNIDNVTNKGPEYSFRSKGDTVSNRTSFLESKLQNGYIYQAAPATLSANVSSSQYSPDKNVVLCKAPNRSFGKNERFGRANDKQYISRKHSQAQRGLDTPAAYAYENNCIGKKTYNAGGQWK